MGEIEHPTGRPIQTTSLQDVNNFGVAVGEAQTAEGIDLLVWSERGNKILPIRTEYMSINDWGTIVAAEPRYDGAELVVVDGFGFMRDAGSLGGKVQGIAINELFQIAWTVYPPGGGVVSYFCQLP